MNYITIQGNIAASVADIPTEAAILHGIPIKLVKSAEKTSPIDILLLSILAALLHLAGYLAMLYPSPRHPCCSPSPGW